MKKRQNSKLEKRPKRKLLKPKGYTQHAKVRDLQHLLLEIEDSNNKWQTKEQYTLRNLKREQMEAKGTISELKSSVLDQEVKITGRVSKEEFWRHSEKVADFESEISQARADFELKIADLVNKSEFDVFQAGENHLKDQHEVRLLDLEARAKRFVGTEEVEILRVRLTSIQAAQEGSIKGMTHEVAVMRTDVSDLESKVNIMQTRIDNLVSREILEKAMAGIAAGLESRIGHLEAKVKESQSELDSIRPKLNNLSLQMTL